MNEIGLFDKLIASIGIPLAIVVMIIIYTKGNVVTEVIDFFKPKQKKDDFDRYNKLVDRVSEENKIREENYRNVINEQNEQNKKLSIIIEKNTKIMEEQTKIMESQTNTNKQLVMTNKELFNKMNFKMDSIEDKVNNIIDDIEDLKESTTIIKTRTENN